MYLGERGICSQNHLNLRQASSGIIAFLLGIWKHTILYNKSVFSFIIFYHFWWPFELKPQQVYYFMRCEDTCILQSPKVYAAFKRCLKLCIVLLLLLRLSNFINTHFCTKLLVAWSFDPSRSLFYSVWASTSFLGTKSRKPTQKNYTKKWQNVYQLMK